MGAPASSTDGVDKTANERKREKKKEKERKMEQERETLKGKSLAPFFERQRKQAAKGRPKPPNP